MTHPRNCCVLSTKPTWLEFGKALKVLCSVVKWVCHVKKCCIILSLLKKIFLPSDVHKVVEVKGKKILGKSPILLLVSMLEFFHFLKILELKSSMAFHRCVHYTHSEYLSALLRCLVDQILKCVHTLMFSQVRTLSLLVPPSRPRKSSSTETEKNF